VRDSFAHHPAAITADLATVRDLTEGRVLVVFEPSGAARTAVFGPAMGRALAGADEVILLGVHRAVATEVQAGTAGIAEAITTAGGRVQVAERPGQAAALAVGLSGPGDVIVAMGTGTVAEVGGKVLARLEAAPVTVS
jgi:UDP-N-acetylmuramate--alanine ligase